VSREQIMSKAADLCEQAGCNEKKQELHLKQALRGWDAHPSQEFCVWWSKHADFREGILARVAWNCDSYRQEFLSAKEVGLA
jgi:hypothetical protein